MSWLDATFGVIFDNGTELEVLGGLNFIGFTITEDAENGRHNISVAGAATSSDEVSNESDVSGATVTDALDTLLGAIAVHTSAIATNTSNIATNTSNIATNTASISTLNGRTLTAGAGLTGGGTLSADRTFNVAAADSTITVNADSIQVGTIGNGNLSNNTITLARLVNAGAQYDFLARKSASGGAWEDCTATESRAALLADGVGFLMAHNTVGLVGVRSGGGTNPNLIRWGVSGTNWLSIGDNTQLDTVSNRALTAHDWRLNSALILQLNPTTLDFTSTVSLTNLPGINGAKVAAPVEGTALTDADQTLTVAGGNDYTQSTALTASRTKTLGTTGSPETGEIITIKRFTTAAFTMPVVNGGAGAGTLYTFPSGGKRVADFRYDGTNWVFLGAKRLA